MSPLQHLSAPSSGERKEPRAGTVSGTTEICLPGGTKEFPAAWQALKLPSLQQSRNKTNKATNVLRQAGYWEESSLGQAVESAAVLAQSGPCKGSDAFLPLHHDFC